MNTKAWGIATMVCGILSLVIPVLGFFLALFALIVGLIILSKLSKSDTAGKGFAIAGIVLGATGLVLSLVVLGALSYFGVLNPTKFSPDSCVLDGQFTCRNYVFINGSSLSLNVVNNLNQTVTITKVILKNRIPCVGSTAVLIPPGETGDVRVSFSNCHFDSNSPTFHDLSIEYLPESSSIKHISNGRLSVK